MDPELIAVARSVDTATLGARVRDARVRLGLTQGQLAGKEMSTGYVSRIESGQRRPDPTLLDIIAERLATTPELLLVGSTRDDLAELRLTLDWAQLSLNTGDAERTLTGVDSVLAGLAGTDADELRREALHVRALALEASGRLQDAIMLLEDLAKEGPVDLVWINGLIVLSRSYRETGDLGRAIETCESAAKELSEHGLDGCDEAIKLTLSLAASYFERGDADHAARLCRRAMAKAEEMNSPEAKALAYWNASNIESLRGNVAAALPLASRAVSLLDMSDDARNVARLRTQLGMLELSVNQGHAHGALAHLQQAEVDLKHTHATPMDIAANHLYQARAYFALGDLDRTDEVLAECRRVCGDAAPLITAQAAALCGQAAIVRNDDEAASHYYREAVMLLSSVGDDHGSAQLWFELATLFEESGDIEGAVDAYRRAGASTGLRAPVMRARKTHTAKV